MLFIIFVPYAMLPLPLKWCMVGGTISGTAHLIFMSLEKLEKNSVSKKIVRKLDGIFKVFEWFESMIPFCQIIFFWIEQFCLYRLHRAQKSIVWQKICRKNGFFYCIDLKSIRFVNNILFLHHRNYDACFWISEIWIGEIKKWSWFVVRSEAKHSFRRIYMNKYMLFVAIWARQ